jgi:hypothetical protein
MMQQQQGGAGGAGAGQGCQADTLDCQCRHPRHPAGVVCWVTNPHLAPADWRPPDAGPDNEVYQRNCHRTCVQPRLAGGDRRREQQQRPEQRSSQRQQEERGSRGRQEEQEGRASSSQRVGASGWPTGRTAGMCVPPQDRWIFNERPAANGTSWLAGSRTAERLWCGVGVTAAVTRQQTAAQGALPAAGPSRQTAAAEVQAGPRCSPDARSGAAGESDGVAVMVPLKWGRDSDVVEELAATSRLDGRPELDHCRDSGTCHDRVQLSSAREQGGAGGPGVAGGEDGRVGADAAAQGQRAAAAGQPPGSADRHRPGEHGGSSRGRKGKSQCGSSSPAARAAELQVVALRRRRGHARRGSGSKGCPRRSTEESELAGTVAAMPVS